MLIMMIVLYVLTSQFLHTQVSLLLLNFTSQEHAVESDERREIIDKVNQYNRRFSGAPRSVSCSGVRYVLFPPLQWFNIVAVKYAADLLSSHKAYQLYCASLFFFFFQKNLHLMGDVIHNMLAIFTCPLTNTCSQCSAAKVHK